MQIKEICNIKEYNITESIIKRYCNEMLLFCQDNHILQENIYNESMEFIKTMQDYK